MTFYIGLHMLAHLHRFGRCMVSVNRLWNRVSDINVNDWIMDSGAFTQVTRHGEHTRSVSEYADAIHRWAECGNLLAAVSQDYMCEPHVRAKTGKTTHEHQRLTVDRYARLREQVSDSIHVMPVLQGYKPHEYLRHIEMYGDLLPQGAWVGVGSVCKRNADVSAIEGVLGPIAHVRPDLRLHGFGVKLTALQSPFVRRCLHTADSMAWSHAARYEGRDANCWKEARKYEKRIQEQSSGTMMSTFESRARSAYMASQERQLSLWSVA